LGQQLIGLRIALTFNDNGKTRIQHYSLRVSGGKTLLEQEQWIPVRTLTNSGCKLPHKRSLLADAQVYTGQRGSRTIVWSPPFQITSVVLRRRGGAILRSLRRRQRSTPEAYGRSEAEQGDSSASCGDALAEYWGQIGEPPGDLLVVGLGRAGERIARRWQELVRMGAALGFGRRVQPVERLAAELAWKAHTLRWEAHRAAEAMLELASVALLAVDALNMNAA
jgi:hypothetical protein